MQLTALYTLNQKLVQSGFIWESCSLWNMCIWPIFAPLPMHPQEGYWTQGCYGGKPLHSNTRSKLQQQHQSTTGLVLEGQTWLNATAGLQPTNSQYTHASHEMCEAQLQRSKLGTSVGHMYYSKECITAHTLIHPTRSIGCTPALQGSLQQLLATCTFIASSLHHWLEVPSSWSNWRQCLGDVRWDWAQLEHALLVTYCPTRWGWSPASPSCSTCTPPLHFVHSATHAAKLKRPCHGTITWAHTTKDHHKQPMGCTEGFVIT